MSDLKACPFCGGEAYIYDTVKGCSLGCMCGVSVSEPNWTQDRAIEIWNNRAPQDNWISVGVGNTKLNPKGVYHVFIPARKEIVICRFNDYRSIGGARDYWQDLHDNDLDMQGTKFIEIVTPTPPTI